LDLELDIFLVGLVWHNLTSGIASHLEEVPTFLSQVGALLEERFQLIREEWVTSAVLSSLVFLSALVKAVLRLEILAQLVLPSETHVLLRANGEVQLLWRKLWTTIFFSLALDDIELV